MAELASPNVLNYSVFKGNVYWTPAGGGSRRHVGNCTQFSFEPAVDVLDHFSAMQGVKTKDFSVTLQKSASVSITLEEMTLKNLQLALLGGPVAADTDTTDGGLLGFEILAVSQNNGVLELINTNDVGPKYHITLPSVNLRPNGAVEFIGSDDWANCELQGDVLAVGSSFGRIDLLDSGTTTT